MFNESANTLIACLRVHAQSIPRNKKFSSGRYSGSCVDKHSYHKYFRKEAAFNTDLVSITQNITVNNTILWYGSILYCSTPVGDHRHHDHSHHNLS
jgi:hypothetical protein